MLSVLERKSQHGLAMDVAMVEEVQGTERMPRVPPVSLGAYAACPQCALPWHSLESLCGGNEPPRVGNVYRAHLVHEGECYR